MLLSKLATVLSVGFLLAGSLAAVGCAGPAESTSAGAAALETAEGVFKLYEEETTADPQCDVHTVLDLTHQRIDGELRAHLRDAAEGACRINVDANERDYQVVLSGTECGSKIYTGANMNGEGTIRITDNRERICNDYVPAIVVEEQSRKGTVRTLQAAAQ